MDALAAWIATNVSDEKLAALRSMDWSSRTAASDWTMDDWKLYRLVLLFDHIPRRECGGTKVSLMSLRLGSPTNKLLHPTAAA
jgi:hypothetical protein